MTKILPPVFVMWTLTIFYTSVYVLQYTLLSSAVSLQSEYHAIQCCCRSAVRHVYAKYLGDQLPHGYGWLPGMPYQVSTPSLQFAANPFNYNQWLCYVLVSVGRVTPWTLERLIDCCIHWQLHMFMRVFVWPQYVYRIIDYAMLVSDRTCLYTTGNNQS